MNEKKVTGSNNFGARGWVLVIYSFLVYLITTAIVQMFNVTGPYYQETFGWSTVQLNGMITLGGVISVVVCFFIGSWAMRFSPRVISIILGIALIIIYMLFGVVSNLVLFTLLLIISRCIGDSVSFMMIGNLMANWFPRKRGAAMGWATFGMPVAGALGATILLWGLNTFGIKGAYGPYSFIILVCVILMIFVLRDYPEQCGCYPDNDPMAVRTEESKMVKYTGEWTTKKVLSNKNFWLVTLGTGLMMFCAGFMPQVIYVLTDIDFNMKYFLAVMYGIATFACLGSWFVGMLDIKLGTKKAFLITAGCIVVSGLLALIPTTATTIIALLFFSITLGGGSNLLVSMITGIWGKEHFGPVFRWSQPICNLIVASATFVIAWFADLTSYRGSFGLAAIIGAIAIVLICFVKKDAFKSDIAIHEHMVNEGVAKE